MDLRRENTSNLSISERNEIIEGLRAYDITQLEIFLGDGFNATLISEAGTNLDITSIFPEIAFDLSQINLSRSLELLAEDNTLN